MKGWLFIVLGLIVLALMVTAAFGVIGLLDLGGLIIALIGIVLIGHGIDTVCGRN